MDTSTFKKGQLESIQHLDGPLLICAGAGSGKTFTLTQRITAALLPGSGKDGGAFLQSIDQALIITFTNAAASELRDRVRSSLRAEGLAEEALKVDGAWISTIHGMCSRIIREHALEFGVDPQFKIVMEAEQAEMLQQAIATVVQRFNQGATNRFDGVFNAFSTDSVKSMLKTLLDEAGNQTAGLDAIRLGPQPQSCTSLARAMLEPCEALLEVATNKTAENLPPIVEVLQAYLADPNATDEVFDELLEDINPSAIAMRSDAAADAKTAIKLAKSIRAFDVAAPLASDLLDLAREVDAEYRAVLNREAAVDTSGLISMTLRAFDEHPDLARRYSSLFKLIMVDEFQDTSQLQVDMIERIAGPQRQHLCTVGDSQQSIYRFQGADVAVYLKHKKEMAALGAKTARLDDNFRSHGDILAFVRAICGQPGYFQEDFLDLQAATDGKPYHSTDPRVEVSLVEYPRGSSQQAAAAEAEHIAQRFAALREAGHSAGEMVILLGTTTHTELYAQALRDHDFACIVMGGTHFFESPHVQLCQSLLNTLANPYDSASLLDVLASDVMPVSSDDLLYLSTFMLEDPPVPCRQDPARGMLLDDRAPMRSSALLQRAMTVLHRAWDKLGTNRPSRVLMETLVDTGWLDRMQQGGVDGQAMAGDVLKFVRLVADAEQETGYDMARTAQAVATLFAASKEKKGALSVDNLDAVRIMTVHGSKGLEFPIVAVANCYHTMPNRSPLFTLSTDGTVQLSLRPSGLKFDMPLADSVQPANAKTSAEFCAAISRENTAREYAERRRLFYVAATRASCALIVSLCHQTTKQNEYKEVEGDILSGLCPGKDDFPAQSGTLEYGGSQPLTFTRIAVAPDGAQEDPETPVERQERDLVIGMPPLVDRVRVDLSPVALRKDFYSYSSLAHGDGSAPAAPALPDDVMPDEEALVAHHPAADLDKATEFGSALHRLCEWLALQSAAPSQQALAAAQKRFIRSYAIHDADRLLAAFDRWMQSDVRAQAFARERHQPEVPFCVALNDEVLEGEIDLLCTDAGSDAALIIDYKTGGNPQETADQLHDKHLLQAQCYAFAVLGAGLRSVELRFVRVEQADRDDDAQPQVVPYRFTSDDLPALRAAISAARRGFKLAVTLRCRRLHRWVYSLKASVSVS